MVPNKSYTISKWPHTRNVFTSCKLTRINPVNSLQAVYIYFTHWKSNWQKEFVGNPFNFRGWQKHTPPLLLSPSGGLIVSALIWQIMLGRVRVGLQIWAKSKSVSTYSSFTAPVPSHTTSQVKTRSVGLILIEKQIMLVKPHTESIQVTVQSCSSGRVWGGLILDSNLERGV